MKLMDYHTHHNRCGHALGGIHALILDAPEVIFLAGGKGSEAPETLGEDTIHTAYFEKMTQMVETGYFDIIAHLDNHRLLWAPQEPVYSDDVWLRLMELLDRIKSKGMAVEINTSGTWKGATSQFPGDDIVKELNRRQIPLTLCSDAHRPQEVGHQFHEFIQKAIPWGLTHLCLYEKRRQILIPTDGK